MGGHDLAPAGVTIGLGGLAGLLTSIWSQIRRPVAIEGDAWLCTSGHPFMIWSGDQWPSGPAHIDVNLRFWIQRGTKSATILDLESATINAPSSARAPQGGQQRRRHRRRLRHPHRELHGRNNVYTRVLVPARTAAGLPWVGFHTFRHTCATRLFRHGLNAKQVQLWLGHHSPAFTLATYVHLVPEDLPSADFLDALPREATTGRALGRSAVAGEVEVPALELDPDRAIRGDSEMLDLVEGDPKLEHASG
jgi:hypothetical protein